MTSERSRPVRNLRAISVTAAGALLLTPAAVWACRCVPLTTAAAARKADVVVLATVERAARDRPHYAEYEVRVARSWKAKVPARLTIRTRQTNCMADLADGEAYLLYLKRGDGGLETSLCSGNLPAARAGGAMKALGRPQG